MIFRKKGILGEGILTLYRLVLVMFIALIVLGMSAVFYDYYINVRSSEAVILLKESVNCVAPKGIFNESIFKDNKKSFLEKCGFGKEELERFYIRVTLVGGKENIVLEQGNSGLFWVQELFSAVNQDAVKKIEKYRPGHEKENYPLIIEGKKGIMEVEVLVNNEV